MKIKLGVIKLCHLIEITILTNDQQYKNICSYVYGENSKISFNLPRRRSGLTPRGCKVKKIGRVTIMK